MGSVWQDLRYAVRKLANAPGLTAVLAFTLAIGVGASTTIFSVVNSILLEPLPYHEPDRLVRVYTEFHGRMELDRFPFSPPELADFRRECRSCERVGAWSTGTASLAGGDRAERIEAAYVTHDLLPTLGVPPLLGRYIDATEDRPGDQTVIVLSYRVWQRVFGGDPNIIGRKITSDAQPVTVVGVMPEGFDFLGNQEAWLPQNLDYAKAHRGGHYMSVVVRLKPGVTRTQLDEEIAALLAGWQREWAGPNSDQHSLTTMSPYLPSHPIVTRDFQTDLVASLSSTLWLLQGAVLFVLLIAIVNVANLLLAKSETRTREVAVRHALGASRGRLLRQFFTESLVLGLLGGGLGILVAVWAVDGVAALVPDNVPRANEIALDTRAVAFAVACSLGASLLFGLAPIMHARRTNLHGALKDGSNRMTGSKSQLRVRRALVIAEIALAVVLVIGCTVMVRTFVRLQKIEPGFDPDHVLTFQVEIPLKTYPGTNGDVYWRRLLDRMRAMPGVTSAALVGGLPPVRFPNFNDIHFVGKEPPRAGTNDPAWSVDAWNIVSDDALPALGARLVRGRAIGPEDVRGATKVVLVNEAFAHRFYPDGDAIGQRIKLNGNYSPYEQVIVGIVGDMKNLGLEQPVATELFIPIFQSADYRDPPESQYVTNVVLRTERAPREYTSEVYRALADVDPTIPMSQLRTMDDVMWKAVARPRFLTLLLSCFAGIALLLAAVGIYGVMAHTVTQRTHEIGLRVALGARPSQVRAMVLRQAGILVGIGVAVGLLTAVLVQLALDASLRKMLYGAQLNEPVMLVGVAVAVSVTALIATWLPARRATKVEPTVALRSE